MPKTKPAPAATVDFGAMIADVRYLTPEQLTTLNRIVVQLIRENDSHRVLDFKVGARVQFSTKQGIRLTGRVVKHGTRRVQLDDVRNPNGAYHYGSAFARVSVPAGMLTAAASK